jgi:hypothetical protein
MRVENVGVQVEVDGDESPDTEEGEEAEERAAGAVTTRTAGLDDVEGGLESVEDEDEGALNKVPLREGEVVDIVRNEGEGLWYAEGAEHGLLPEVRATHVTGEGIDEDENEDALDGSVNDAEREGLGVVFIPGLNVEGEES